jgi:hypothetical protein
VRDEEESEKELDKQIFIYNPKRREGNQNQDKNERNNKSNDSSSRVGKLV